MPSRTCGGIPRDGAALEAPHGSSDGPMGRAYRSAGPAQECESAALEGSAHREESASYHSRFRWNPSVQHYDELIDLLTLSCIAELITLLAAKVFSHDGLACGLPLALGKQLGQLFQPKLGVCGQFRITGKYQTITVIEQGKGSVFQIDLIESIGSGCKT